MEISGLLTRTDRDLRASYVEWTLWPFGNGIPQTRAAVRSKYFQETGTKTHPRKLIQIRGSNHYALGVRLRLDLAAKIEFLAARNWFGLALLPRTRFGLALQVTSQNSDCYGAGDGRRR